MPPHTPPGEQDKRFETPEEKRKAREQFFERLARLGDALDGVSDEDLDREIRRAQTEVKDELARERLDKNLRLFSEAFRDVPEEDFERALAEARREYREITDSQHGRP